MSWLDLHMHSNYSDDGEFSPEELMSICRENGVRTAALADHNTVRGVPEAQAAATRNGVTLIPAVELDCVCLETEIHLLGYWIDPGFPGFLEVEKDVQRQEQKAAQERVRLVQGLGIHVDLREVMRHTKNGVVTGELIAEVALEAEENKGNPILLPYRPGGARSDNPLVNFYWDYCSQGKPAFVPIRYIGLDEAVSLVRRSGGIPVLAHPGINVKEHLPLLEEIVGKGVVGIEAYSSYHSREQAAFYAEQAQSLGLAISCGSDFHGKIKPAIRMGGVDCGGLEELLLSGLEEKHRECGACKV